MAETKQPEITAAGLKRIYRILLKYYGPQGWWPIRSRRMTAGADLSNTLGFNSGGYHPGTRHEPSGEDAFEIAAGAVLTQNTNWNNASAALDRLIDAGMMNPAAIKNAHKEDLAQLIRSSGYFNQKTARLKEISVLFLKHDMDAIDRGSLLALKGIGPETADSIMLYGLDRPEFIIDAYTRRILSRYFADESIEKISYDALKDRIESLFPADNETWREFHALIVIHARKFCIKNPVCTGCPLNKGCIREK